MVGGKATINKIDSNCKPLKSKPVSEYNTMTSLTPACTYQRRNLFCVS